MVLFPSLERKLCWACVRPEVTEEIPPDIPHYSRTLPAPWFFSSQRSKNSRGFTGFSLQNIQENTLIVGQTLLNKNETSHFEEDERNVKALIQDTIGFKEVDRKIEEFMLGWASGPWNVDLFLGGRVVRGKGCCYFFGIESIFCEILSPSPL